MINLFKNVCTVLEVFAVAAIELFMFDEQCYDYERIGECVTTLSPA